MEHILQLVIGKAGPITKKLLLKRLAAAERLIRSLLLSCKIDAEFDVRHLEADKQRILEIPVQLLRPRQFDLFGSTGENEASPVLMDRLYAAGNEAMRRFLATQRASLAEVGSWLAETDTCTAADMKIVSALQDFPDRIVRFIDPAGQYAFGHSGLRGTTVHPSPIFITALVQMAGVRGAELTQVSVPEAPPGLEFKSSARLVVPRDASEAAIDALFASARRQSNIELTVYPSYSLIRRKVGVLYLKTDRDGSPTS